MFIRGRCSSDDSYLSRAYLELATYDPHAYSCFCRQQGRIPDNFYNFQNNVIIYKEEMQQIILDL